MSPHSCDLLYSQSTYMDIHLSDDFRCRHSGPIMSSQYTDVVVLFAKTVPTVRDGKRFYHLWKTVTRFGFYVRREDTCQQLKDLLIYVILVYVSIDLKVH